MSSLTQSRQALFGGTQPWPAFIAVNDTVRGGKSSSSWRTDTHNRGQFQGVLDTTALGGAGFASQSATFQRLEIDNQALGLELSLVASENKGSEKNPNIFTLVLKNERAKTRPDGRRESVLSYEFSFSAPTHHEQLIFAPWTAFQATYRGRRQKDAPPLDPHNIKE
ncbi:hypothetical protein OIV83_005135 [Microbotryomycetes sp. JL201]|nr:hypothetical protein OIV83_005135 [Microbotryomycetes sp. JL201]